MVKNEYANQNRPRGTMSSPPKITVTDQNEPGILNIGRNIQRKVIHKKTPSSFFLNFFQSQDPSQNSQVELEDIKKIVEKHEEKRDEPKDDGRRSGELSRTSGESERKSTEVEKPTIYWENYDHFEHDRVEFYNISTSLKQNAMQLQEEKDVKIKARYQYAIKENLKKISTLKDVLVIKYKDLKGHTGIWKDQDLNRIKELVDQRRTKILDTQVEFDYVHNKCTPLM